MIKLKKIIFLVMLCVTFLSSCQVEEHNPVFSQSSEDIFRLWSDMSMHSIEFIRLDKQADDTEQELEHYLFVYQITSVLTNLSIIGDLLNEKYLINPSVAAYLFGMVNAHIYHNKRLIRQYSEYVSSSDNQTLKESYQKTIEYLNKINDLLEPLEIPLIKASGEDPQKVKQQIEWLDKVIRL